MCPSFRLHPLGIFLAVFFNLPTRSPTSKLFLQALVRIGLDVDDIFPVIAGNLANMRGVGIQRVFDQQDGQLLIAFVQGGTEAFGGVALTVVLARAIVVDNRFKVQRENLLLLRMHKHGSES